MIFSLLLFSHSATLEAGSCTFTTVGSVAFGNYDVLSGSPVDSTGAIRYSCTSPVSAPRISLDSGSGSSFSPRALRSGSHRLSYNLFLDAARTTIWGDGTSGTSVLDVFAPPDGSSVDIPIYGRILAGQDVPRGSYTDGVLVTIEF